MAGSVSEYVINIAASPARIAAVPDRDIPNPPLPEVLAELDIRGCMPTGFQIHPMGGAMLTLRQRSLAEAGSRIGGSRVGSSPVGDLGGGGPSGDGSPREASPGDNSSISGSSVDRSSME